MKVRDAIIGSIVTLGVTVVGGVIVYYVTRQPAAPTKEERLLIFTEAPATFELEKSKFSIVSAEIANLGTGPAKDVSVALVPKRGKILDTKIAMSAGAAAEMPTTMPGDGIRLRIKSMAPNESVTIRAMLDSVTGEKPEVDARSSDSVAVSARRLDLAESDIDQSRIPRVLSITMPLLAALQAGLLIVYRRKFGKLARKLFGSPVPSGHNNLGFSLLHRGLPLDARKVFEKSIETGEASGIELANYALCRTVINPGDGEAERYIEAAKVYEGFFGNRYLKALIDFNTGLIAGLKGDWPNCFASLREAVETEEQVVFFLRNSRISSTLAAANPDFRSELEKSKPFVVEATD